MYTESIAPVLSAYEGFVEGSGTEACWVLTEHSASEAIRTATENTMGAFGFGPHGCGFLETSALGALDIRTIVEAAEPLFLIIADEFSLCLIEEGYEAKLPRQDTARLLGRDVVCFESLNELLQTPQGKQRAWALFKRLPHEDNHSR